MKIIIVDDEQLIKEGLKIILNLQEDIEVIADFGNGQEAVDYCLKNTPDVVLMDIRMPIMDGVLAAKSIKENQPNIKILMLTTFNDDTYIKQAMMYGADGYMLKNQGADKIVDAIRSVYQGHIVFDHQVRASLFLEKDLIPKHQYCDFDITEREADILSLIGRGLSNKEIAESLFLSLGTVRNYVTNLLDKLDLRDRTQLAIFYVKHFE